MADATPSATVRPGNTLANFGRSSIEAQASGSNGPVSVTESRLPTSPQAFIRKHSSGTLSVLSAAALSLKDKTHQVAQHQKRALSEFQQKGGLVGWLHGELDGSHVHSTPVTPRASQLSARMTPCHETPRRSSPAESSIPDHFVAKELVLGRRRLSLPNMNVAHQLDDLESTVATTEKQSEPLSLSFIHLDAHIPSTLTSPPFGPLRSTACFLLEEILSNEWKCIVLWVYLYSTTRGREHQYHQRVSLLIEATFRITPLYRTITACEDKALNVEQEKTLQTLFKRLQCRFLLQPRGLPTASPTASQAKTHLSVAIHALADPPTVSETEGKERLEKAMCSLFELAREVEREFRVLGTKSYMQFAESALYRDFITNEEGYGNVVGLLRSAGIPFYQQPYAEAMPLRLESLVPGRSEEQGTVFSRADVHAFQLVAHVDGSIQFTNLSRENDQIESNTRQALPNVLERFLNPSGHVLRTLSEPFAFNFIAGSGKNSYYGAVMWLPTIDGNAVAPEETSFGVCVESKFPLVNSLRHFLRSVLTSNEDNALKDKTLDLKSASRALETQFLALQKSKALNDKDHELLAIDLKLNDLFDCLSIAHILRLFAFVLLEKKIVLVASSYTVLFSVSEALRVLLYPLVWSHVYVPVLPLALKDCLQCPTPFLLGLHASYVRQSDMPRPSIDVVVVNLDRDSVTGGGDTFLPPLRQSMWREELRRVHKPQLVVRDQVDQFDATESEFPTFAIRQVFYKHVHELLRSLEPCVNRLGLKHQLVSVMDVLNASCWPADAVKFCTALLHTQAVSTYLASSY